MLSHQILWSFFALGLLSLSQCRGPKEPPPPKEVAQDSPMQHHTYQQTLMGTKFYVTIYIKDQPRAKTQADLAARAAFEITDKINDACSDYDVTSELMRLNAAPAHQPVELSPILFDVLDTALIIAEQTNGAYDPTLGHHSYNWRMARKKLVLPSSDQIATALAASGWKYLKLDRSRYTITKTKENMRLDLGGIAKGYAADQMLATLNKYLITTASVTAGGEVRLGDPPPDQKGWKVSLKTLDSKHQLSPQVLMLSNCAISTSGDIHQSITIDGKRYSHIVNPSTGLGLTTQISATVIGKQATQTDALATALCVKPSLQLPAAQSLIIYKNSQGNLESSPNKNWPTINTR